VSRPKLLDAFCGEGGAAAGYIAAGFDVTGVDLKNTGKRYPGEFIQADALDYIVQHAHEFDAIHASPPCQGYSIATAGNQEARAKHPRLIDTTRDTLEATSRPWVIENVEQARTHMRNPLLLCGTMFGLSATDDDGTPLEMWRHRLFETNVNRGGQPTCRHGWHSTQVAGSYGGARRDKHEARNIRHGGYVPAKHVQEQMLGIDWMTQNGLYQSIPPIYAEYVGVSLRSALLLNRSAA
jgi:DNA (cytosine-5)-methyltransferase 1